MTTSLKAQWKSVSDLEDAPISPTMLGYFHSGAQHDAHDKVLSTFLELSEREGVTRAFIARRIRKTPEQITRWLGAPGNWTLETLTSLAVAMGYRPRIELDRLSDLRRSNEHHPLAHLTPIRVEVTSSATPAWRISTSNLGG